jgi:anti-sigma factor RsiW
MSGDAFRGLIPAYLDGELTGDELSAFEAHLRGCPDCRRTLESERALTAAVGDALPRASAPGALRERVEAILSPAPARRSRWPVVLAASLGVALLFSWTWHGRRAGDRASLVSPFAALAADTHLRYGRGQLPLEVASERPEDVTRWFERRVPFHLALPRYPVGPGEVKAYRLEGGRLVAFRDDYAAFVAYRMGEQPISLLVTSATTVVPEGGQVVPWGALVFHVEPVAGLNVITWSDKGLTYALAFDVAVEGSRSCLVCHGSAEERRRLERFPGGPGV